MGRFYHNSDGVLMLCVPSNIFKKDDRLRLHGWVFDNLQSAMNTLAEDLYFLHLEIMTNLDHYNSIAFCCVSSGTMLLYIFLFCMHSACSTRAYFEFKTSYTPCKKLLLCINGVVRGRG